MTRIAPPVTVSSALSADCPLLTTVSYFFTRSTADNLFRLDFGMGYPPYGGSPGWVVPRWRIRNGVTILTPKPPRAGRIMCRDLDPKGETHMIIGAHSIIYSNDAEADRKFLRDVLQFPNVDVGDGWLIFGLPPAEVAVHPSDENDVHELYLMCDDIEAFVDTMKMHNVPCDAVMNAGWGLLTHITLPGGGKLGVYQPRHARPEPMQ